MPPHNSKIHKSMKLGLHSVKAVSHTHCVTHHSTSVSSKHPTSTAHSATVTREDKEMDVESATRSLTTSTTIYFSPTPTPSIISGDNKSDSVDASSPSSSNKSSSTHTTNSPSPTSDGDDHDGSDNDGSDSDKGGTDASTTKSSSTNSSNGSSNNNSGNNSNNNNHSSNSNSKGGKFNSMVFNPDPTCQLVSDNDGSLQYTGAWSLESKDPNGFYFTSHTTTAQDSQVSITFNGTSVTVIGVVHASNDTNPPAMASYTIDSFPPISLPLPFTSRDIPNQAFFESAELPLEAHTLTVNVTSNGSPYTLNALSICTKNTNPVAAVVSPPTHPATRVDIPAIIGATVGGVSFIGIVIVAYIFLLRRKRGGKVPLIRSRVLSWLQRRATGTMQFTSTESIMRNNATNPSAADAFDNLSQAEKLEAEGEAALALSPAEGLKTAPRTPMSAMQAMPDSPVLPHLVPTSFQVHRQRSLSFLIPALEVSGRGHGAAGLEGHRRIPSPPPLPRAAIPNDI